MGLSERKKFGKTPVCGNSTHCVEGKKYFTDVSKQMTEGQRRHCILTCNAKCFSRHLAIVRRKSGNFVLFCLVK